jgi:methionine salvage enolase-phosphatase E1
MEKHSKDMENIKVDRDSLQVNWCQLLELEGKKGSLSVEYNKLHKYYKNMEHTFLNQHKELEELKMDISNVYQAKNDIQRQFYQR